MTCRELQNSAPLYLSGELNEKDREDFAAHMAACPACAREIERQELLDNRLIAAFKQQAPDTTKIEQQVRRRIAAPRSRMRWIAASAVAAIGLTYGLSRVMAVPKVYADAAKDHQMEVVEKHPRKWRSNASEIETIAAQNGLSFEQVTALAPANYKLEHAKTCVLDGKRMLHLVFTNGTEEYSVYLSPHQSETSAIRLVRQSKEQVAGQQTGRFTALVVTTGPEAECKELARQTAAHL